MAKMTVTELQAAIGQQIDAALGATGDTITTERGQLIDRYFGEPYGDEVENRSQVVSTDVADTIEWIMPEIMEVMTGGERTVQFDPLGPDDEERAEQETDVVNHVLMRKNEGWLVFYEWFKDALMQKNGYVKRFWETKEIERVEEYDGLGEDEVLALFQAWGQKGYEVEVEEQEVGAEGVRIKARLKGVDERERVVSVPPDELLISSRWHSVTLDDAPFIAHRPNGRTVSDLVAQGYDREQVERLSAPEGDGNEYGDERIRRFDTEDHQETEQNEPIDAAAQEVEVYECYIRVDRNDDGISELTKVTVAGPGREILKWSDGEHDIEEVAEQPFSCITPIIIPHRHVGRSIAELVDDLQRIKTVLTRQMLDNIYLTNNPTREIAEDGIGETTIADLLLDRPGKIVRTAQPGHYMEHAPTPFMGQMLPAIQYVDDVKENRTGITKYTQGLDANSLNKTAHGIEQIMSRADKRIMLIARTFAETGVKHLMRGIHSDLRRNATKRMTVRLRGEFIPVDPRHWVERADLEVNVALGTGSREHRLARLMAIIGKQEENIAAGSPLVTPQNLHHSYEQMVSLAGFKNARAFFTDPNSVPPQPEQPEGPDPQVQAFMQVEGMKIQAQQQSEAAKMQAEAQREAQRMAADREKMLLEDDRERDKMNMEFALRAAEINAKEGTAITVEQIKAAARSASQVNQPNV